MQGLIVVQWAMEVEGFGWVLSKHIYEDSVGHNRAEEEMATTVVVHGREGYRWHCSGGDDDGVGKLFKRKKGDLQRQNKLEKKKLRAEMYCSVI